MAKVKNGRTRTVTERKVYADYSLSMPIEVGKDYSGKSWQEITEEAGERLENYYCTEARPGTAERKIAYYKIAIVNSNSSACLRSAYDTIPHRLFGTDFVLEDVHICQGVVNGYDKMKSETACNEFLERLREENLLVDGYTYESKYGEWFVFYKTTLLLLTGQFWTGEWK